MSLTRYDGTIKGDRLSSLLLYDTTGPIQDSSMYYPPVSTALGLNQTRRYKIAIKFYNPLPCPVCINDITFMMCSAMASSPVMYYTDEQLSGIGASRAYINVLAYTDVLTAGNNLVFQHAATSDITLQPLSASNACYQYVDGATNPSGYDTQFGSLGVYWGDSSKCLHPVTFSFNNLIVQQTRSCYFIFDPASYTDASGGFAVWAPEDFRAININTKKSSGIMMMKNGIWEVATIYKRVRGKWETKEIPMIERDTIDYRRPYDNVTNPDDGPTPPTPPTPPAVPEVIFDGTTWYVPVTQNNQPTRSLVYYNDNGTQIIKDDGKGPEFTLNLTAVSQLIFTVELVATSSYDGYTEAKLIINVGGHVVKVPFSCLGMQGTGESYDRPDVVVDTTALSGDCNILIYTSEYGSGGPHPERETYISETQTKLLYVRSIQ